MSHEQAPGGPAPAPDRYGPIPSPQQRRRKVVIAAVVAAVLGLGSLIWLGAGVLAVPVRTQDAGFAIVDDGAVDVTFFVNRAPGTAVTCRVHALNHAFAEVGARDVRVAASESSSVRVTVRLATSELATTGLVQRCWVTPDP